MKRKIAVTVYQGVAGDHNDLAIPGASAIGEWLAQRSGETPVLIGSPAAAMQAGWREALAVALPDLQAMQARFEQLFAPERFRSPPPAAARFRWRRCPRWRTIILTPACSGSTRTAT